MNPWETLLVLICVLKGVSGLANIQIRLVNYVNPGGNGNNGHPCDGRWIFNGSPCDHNLILCLDNVVSSTSTNRCAFGRASTGEISNADSITFGSRAGRLQNPFTFRVTSWPGSAKLKVRVFDVDDNDDDFVDYMQKVLALAPSNSPRTYRVVVKHRTALSIDVRVYCDPNYFGPQCTLFCRPRNDWMGHYTCNGNGAKVCNKGWQGQNCNRRINICAPCQHGSCNRAANTYNCACHVGFTGTNCERDIDECASNPCLNGGHCSNFIGNYICLCHAGWAGPRCNEDVNECQHVTCRNSGTCVNSPGKYRCECDAGWEGTHCDVDVNECALGHPCNANASCVNVPGTFECTCSDGLSGAACEDINECMEDNPCFGNSTCINEHGSFQCFCPEGWTGDLCDVDVNECEADPCLFNSTCTNLNGSFTCDCPAGMQGTYCDVDINECAADPCVGNSTCVNQEGSFICSCQEGFEGTFCETDIDECASSPCVNNGSCVDQVGGFTCDCQSGWTGELCEEEKDECEGNADPVMINVHGDLSTADLESFNNTLRDVLTNMFLISREDIHPVITSELWTDPENQPMTTVFVSAYAQGAQICQDELSNIFSTTNVFEKTLAPSASIVYEQSFSDGKVGNLHGAAAIETKESWLMSRWYVIAVIAGTFIALVAISIVIFKHRRRPKTVVIAGRNGSLYRNGSLTMPEDTGDENSAIASLSFDNVLYTTFQPQSPTPRSEPTGPEPTDNDNVCT
ncbi:protein jagged-1-like isoform X2 [Argopecten irradians]|uniref:protein jagged-1-like isoform X2 n=1 Tax=Argopecten irradians TaxID=31199 RepID=UPI00371F2998